MDESDVRARAEAFCAALLDGNVDAAIEDLSRELRQHLGEVISLLPLPSIEATVESVERGASSGFTVILRLLGENEEVQIQTRWKDRDGRPTIVELSHLSSTAMEPVAADADEAPDANGEP